MEDKKLTRVEQLNNLYDFADFEWTDKKYYEEKATENHYEKESLP